MHRVPEYVYLTTWQNWNGNGDYNHSDYEYALSRTSTSPSGDVTEQVTIRILDDQSEEDTHTFRYPRSH